jgi:putative transposase
MFAEAKKMPTDRSQQALSYDLRLPDEAQADALRLLDASKRTINAALVALWPRLDEFMSEQPGPAWKQVVAMMDAPKKHGDRQWRCEAETVGRLMRSQAERKQVFQTILPILTDGFIRPKTENRPAGKNRHVIKEAITALQKTLEDDEATFVTLQNVVEQCCNAFLKTGAFPATYEELQSVPLLKVGILTYAGDDGPQLGQSYRLSLDLEAGTASLLFRFPDEEGTWQWRKTPTRLTLPQIVQDRLKQGGPLAPTLREYVHPDGGRSAVLDFIVQIPKAPIPDWETIDKVLGFDWGVHGLITAVVLDAQGQQVSRPWFLQTGGIDGHQARTRRQIDQLKAKRQTVSADDPRRASYDQEIARCWRIYEARNQELAHLAANVLLLLANIFGCSLISGESLKTLKSTGRGRGVRGKWRNWRNTTTIRSEIWHILRYKSHLAGMRFRSERPGGTSHRCPRCGKPANTYRSPRLEHRWKPIKWGRWLVCSHCSYSANRDYAAAVNIARLGVAYLVHIQATNKARAFSVTEISSVKPSPYIAEGAVLLLPPPTHKSRSHLGGKISYPGWHSSVVLRSSYATPILLRLCG